MSVIQTLRFHLRPDVDLVDVVAAADRLTVEHLCHLDGYDPAGRTTTVAPDGGFTLRTRWDRLADAEASAATLTDAPTARKLLDHADPVSVAVVHEVELPSPTHPGAEHARRLYLEGIGDGDARGAMLRHTGDRYTQHSTGVRDGVDGFLEFFGPFLAAHPQRELEIVRTITDGRYVFVHVTQHLDGGATRWVTADLFDTDGNGRVVEHWDTIAALGGTNPSGRTQVDGPTEVTDLHLTESNKEVVRRLLTEGLAKEPTAPLSEFISATGYRQHNPDAPDGLDGLLGLIEAGRRSGETLHYERVHRLVGQGNFVVALSHQVWSGIDYAAFDIFRLDGGLVVEHWDVVEPLPAEADLVNSGKF